MSEKKTYHLDLPTLLVLLKSKSGTLTTKVKIRGHAAVGVISFQEGQITACTVKSINGQIQGKEALDLVRGAQEWDIEFDVIAPTTTITPSVVPPPVTPPPSPRRVTQPLQRPPRPPQPSVSQPPPISQPLVPPPQPQYPQAPVLVPRAMMPLSQYQLVKYTPQQRMILRMVYATVDNRKNVDTIKSQVNLPPETVMEALEVLRQLGCIEY